MNILNTIFEYGASLFDSILCIWYITSFNNKSFKLRTNPYWIPAILIVFIVTVFNDHVFQDNLILPIIILFVLWLSYSLIIEHKKIFKSLFSVITFQVALILINTVIYFLISITISNFETALPGQNNYVRIIYLVLIKMVLWAICKLLLHLFNSDDTNVDIKNSILSLCFSMITVLGLASALYIASNSVEEGIQISSFIISIAFTASNVFLFVMISQVLKLQKHKYNEKLLEDKLTYEQKRYDEVTVIWSDIRKKQHDMKHQLTAINGYLEERQYEECKKYVEKLLPATMNQSKILCSDNIVIDYIINSKLGNLKETVILVTGSIGDISDIEEADLASLLGNLLDNAIEAVAELNEKRIELTFARQDASRVIICKNTIQESVIKNNPEFLTTKKDPVNHGFGVKAIKRIVNKYGGLIDFFEVADMFGVQILLPTQSAER